MAETDIADVPESAQFQFQSADSSDIMMSGPQSAPNPGSGSVIDRTCQIYFSTRALLLQHYPNVPCLIHPVPPPVCGAEWRKKSGIILGPYWHPPPPKKAPHAPATTGKPS